jgi:dipeptidyl aminopeptidase/acylaminoacyl peptidase
MSGLFLSTAWASRLKKIPIWVFHGAKDEIARISESENMVKALKVVGNDVRFSVLPDCGHDILDVYENQELYSWFLQHRLNDGLSGTGTR